MEFLVRIYFIGLIAFVPSQDDRALDVFVLDARQGYSVSDGTRMDPHVPLLLMRAKSCKGPCQNSVQEIANFVFQGSARTPDPAENLRRLRAAIRGGGAWKLDGSQITINPLGGVSRSGAQLQIRRVPKNRRDPIRKLPASRPEAEDFDWVADISKIAPGAGAVDSDALAARPVKNLLAARMKLTEGVVKSGRLVGIENKVVALSFHPLGSSLAANSTYSQALTEWVVAEISVSGEGVRITDTSLKDGKSRSIELVPEEDRNVVEVVVINLPAGSFFADPRQLSDEARNVGKHFERYYELLSRPPRSRPVPHFADGESIPWKSLYPSCVGDSELLKVLGLQTRGIQGRPICPVAQFSSGAER